MRFGLQARFLGVLAVVAVIAVASVVVLRKQQLAHDAAISAYAHASIHAQLTQALQRRGAAIIGASADSLANPLYYFDLNQIGEKLRTLLKEPDVEYAIVFDAKGRILQDGSFEVDRFGVPMEDAFAVGARDAKSPHVQWSAQGMDIAAPIKIGAERIGGVRLGFSLKTLQSREADAQRGMHAMLQTASDRYLTTAGLMVSLIGLILIAIAWLVGRGLVHPIRLLAAAAQRMAAGDYSTSPLDTARHDEMGDLFRAFDKMREGVDRQDRQIRQAAYTDSLTGLPNRLAFREMVDRALPIATEGDELALLFIDLDEFKRVNDFLGHDAGDEVLIRFAERLRAALRDEASTGEVARFGGDEFVVLLHGRELRPQAERLAQAIIESLQRPMSAATRTVHLAVSIGIAVAPTHADDAMRLLKNGDIAMYRAKLAGKGRWCVFHPSMDQDADRLLRLENELREAWSRGELQLLYQPIHALSDGRMHGVEALLRWAHPTEGQVDPDVFIPIAEKTGLIDVLGRQVLASACADASGWKRRDAAADSEANRPYVAVNLSARQLRSPELVEAVRQALDTTGLEPWQLHLEITETTVMLDEPSIRLILHELRALGVRIWLDDFGTGFSGLNHLRQIPVDGVKIDRSFISDITVDPDDLALTSSIISLAHSLGILVIAEGVETREQLDLLRTHGCDFVQGFVYSSALTSEEILRRFQG